MGLLEIVRNMFGGGGSGASGEGGPEMICCEEAVERIFEYLDGELEGVSEEQVTRHFEACERCYPRLRFEQAFQQAIQRVRAGEEPPESVRRQVLEVLQAEGFEDS